MLELMKLGRTLRPIGALALALTLGAWLAHAHPGPDGPPPAPDGFEPARCGERHLRLFEGDFDQFWSYVERHGWGGVGEFAWSVPQAETEPEAEWRARAKECFLEVERRNHHRTEPVGLYTLGYFLWHGGVVFGFERDPEKQPGVRERGYRMLLKARQVGFEKAAYALVGVHFSMIRAIDTAALRHSRAQGAEHPPPPPDWWPSNDRLLQDLNAMGSRGIAAAYLSLSAIYRERWLMAEYFGVDHLGRKVEHPDPALKRAYETYDHWYETVRARQNLPAAAPSPRP